MEYEGYSVVGSNEAHRERIREAALRQEQLDELKQAIKMRLEREIETFIADLQVQYKASDIEEHVFELKGDWKQMQKVKQGTLLRKKWNYTKSPFSL